MTSGTALQGLQMGDGFGGSGGTTGTAD